MRRVYSYLLVLVSIYSQTTDYEASGKSAYRMEGVVTDSVTQEPVANTTVQVLITSEPDPAKKILKVHTDDRGRYAIELPVGHAWAWQLELPDGYCPENSNPTEVFATSDEHPVFTKNYQVRKGFPIKVVVRYPDTLATLPKAYVSIGQQKGSEYIYGMCELDGKERGTVNLPQLAGTFNIHCADEQQTLVTADGMTADFEEGFDPRSVKSEVKRGEDGTVVVRDENDRIATFKNCDAAAVDKQLTLTIKVDAVRSNEASTKLAGRVVDAAGQGIAGANVTLSFHSGFGSASSQITATADKDGKFSVGVPKLAAGQKIGLTITRDGFGGVDTEPMDLGPAENGVVKIDTVTLKPGNSIRVRVVGPDGKPLHGAVVEPSNDYASRTRIARTGPDGECVLTDLAAGMMAVTAQFGTLATSTKIPLDEGENEVVTLKLTPPITAPSKEQPKQLPALAAGTPAPEWEIAEWTDGKDRKLSDYRGKVVVLDFWGVWCGPCIHAIPAMKELHSRFKDRDVVFLGVHTAGTDMALVKRLLKQQDWDYLVGLDTGDDIVTGETVRRFAVQGYPNVIVVDRNGTIAFNSGEVPKDREVYMREMEALAQSAGLPWPLDQDATEEELIERMTKLQVAMYGRKIDEALQVKPE
jgi:thiol-disulfide isomerase/thioredoxin